MISHFAYRGTLNILLTSVSLPIDMTFTFSLGYFQLVCLGGIKRLLALCLYGCVANHYICVDQTLVKLKPA